jgi:hypothetical protein
VLVADVEPFRTRRLIRKRKVDIRHHPGLGIRDRPGDDRAANWRIECGDQFPANGDDLLPGPLGGLGQGIGLDQTGIGPGREVREIG